MAPNTSSKPRILLIGAGGQLGRALAQSLPGVGEIVATTRCGGTLSHDLPSKPLDLEDLSAVRHLVREVHPRVIVNAAAFTAVDAAETQQTTATALNATAPGALSEEAERLGATLIHFSTDYVFDGQGERPWREDDACGPLNVYGETKLAGERAIEAAGINHFILRTSWVYGVHGPNFVKTMLRLAERGTPLDVVADQWGAPTSAQALATGTTALLSKLLGNQSAGGAIAPRGTYHMACAGVTSWHGFAETIFDVAAELSLPIARPEVRATNSTAYRTAARRPANSRLDTTRLTRELGVLLPQWEAELRANLEEIFAQYQRDRAAEPQP